MDNYKEKYNKALKKALDLYNQGLINPPLEHIFPELKEREDERIKREILELVSISGNGNQYEEIKDWLEKQGEQQTNKVEPKFKVGDWLQYRYAEPFLVEEITEQGYCNGNSCLPFEWEDEIHPWTIQDAKDGDVLAFDDDTIVIFKDLYNSSTFHSYCHIEDGIFDISKDDMPDWWEGKGFQPATKEQRDTLIKTMADAGYAFDFEKKELKKIEQNSADKLEPKFKVGDWITDGYVHCKITEILDDRYIIESKYNKRSAILFENKNRYHLWTINDAQDGDILSGEIDGEVFVFLFNQIQGRWIVAHVYYSETEGEFIEKAYLHRYHSFSPATEEQHNLLFQKMEEAGYDWDSEKKKLKKVESKTSLL